MQATFYQEMHVASLLRRTHTCIFYRYSHYAPIPRTLPVSLKLDTTAMYVCIT